MKNQTTILTTLSTCTLLWLAAMALALTSMGCTTTEGYTGDSCATGSDCYTGECLTELQPGTPGPQFNAGPAMPLPGGYCSQSCDYACPTELEVCVNYAGGPGICAATCQQDSDCPREGYTCVDLGSWPESSACLPAVGS